MRKVILDLAVTLDGFIEGVNGETDWCIMDDDMDFDSFLSSIDTIFYGRVSYDMWGNVQPDSNSSQEERAMWSKIHSKKKYVFSSKLRKDSNATFISSSLVEVVDEIRQKEGLDIWLYGGSKLTKTFMELELIDIYRISIHPILLGAGRPLFDNLKKRVNLELIDVNRFRSGVVQLIYKHTK